MGVLGLSPQSPSVVQQRISRVAAASVPVNSVRNRCFGTLSTGSLGKGATKAEGLGSNRVWLHRPASCRASRCEVVGGERHLHTTEADFPKATHHQTHSGAEISEPDGNAVVRPRHGNEKAPESPGLSVSSRDIRNLSVPRRGAEQSHDSPGKSTADAHDDALSDAFSDSRLVKLIEVWPALSEDVKEKILGLAGHDIDDLNDVTTEMVLGENGLS